MGVLPKNRGGVTSGTTWYSGVSYNVNNGEVGDFFFDTDDYQIYQKLDSGWTLLSNIKGSDGKDGLTPTITINSEGYWVINGVTSGTKAVGKDGKDGINGSNGKDGNGTFSVEINTNGYWVINGKVTDVKASAINGIDGKDGQDGKNGLDGKDGINGKDGASWITGTLLTSNSSNISRIIPNSKVGDLYFNTTTAAVYECIGENLWKYIITLKPESNPGVDMISNVVDLVMFMGQSNMAGRGDYTQAPVVPSGHGYEFRAVSDPTKLYDISGPFGVNENRGVISETVKTGDLIPAFMNSYYEYTGIPIVGVSASKGSTKLEWWMPNGDALNETIARLKSAQTYLNENGYEIRHQYMVWLQGEADATYNVSGNTYNSNLKLMFSEMKKNGIEKLMMIRIGDKKSDEIAYDEIISAQTKICKEEDDFVLISGKLAGIPLSDMKDEAHFNQTTYNDVGADAGKNMAYFVNTGMEPYFYDLEFQNYYPFGGIEYNHESDVKSVIVDVSKNTHSFENVGVVSNGKVTVPAGSLNKVNVSDVTLSDDYSWTYELVVGNMNAFPNGSMTGAGVIANSGSEGSGFISVPFLSPSNSKYNTGQSHFRFRDEGNTFQIDIKLPSDYDSSEIHHLALVYNADNKSFKSYIDKVEVQITYTLGSAVSTFNDTKLINFLGGYPVNVIANFAGDFYYFAFHNKVLSVSDMYNIQ